MKPGELSDYFAGVGTKVLMGTEINPTVSRGHELQGVNDFRVFLGTPSEKTSVPVTYVWLSDDTEPLSVQSQGTWYNSRQRQPHRDPEYRLYYPSKAEEIVYKSEAGDRLFLCQPHEGPLLAIICPKDSTIEQQLLWLFGLQLTDSSQITQVDYRRNSGRTIDFAARYILELLNIEAAATADQWLDRMLHEFQGGFPSTQTFANFTRKLARDVDPVSDPDGALVAWMDLEERLFLTLERHIVGQRLEQGFMLEGRPDVDQFVSYSLSVQNRRKSRAGFAFANHIEHVLQSNAIKYKREATTEKRQGPDFLFPDESAYRDINWPDSRLTMLAAKTSCKDRWRQALAEANRIQEKHLITLEPGISLTQTAEMRRERLQLVVPQELQSSYRSEQLPYLLNVNGFIELVRHRQLNS